ncbi:hypothetical protein BDZ94DRAFT_291971 [Collybia nuda]|uniref:CFEM domain-containing protein n=1 Tax=Collybia nuda TaxID=64659 RepID=A0A9P5XTZ2_9AGAR|nr:hypothetical protein BDZ94DRAFT_291971 [Collybia nuda]
MARLSLSLFPLFVFLRFAAAQGPSSLPQCALNCANTASKAAGCALTDIPCLCSHQSFISATLQCSHSTCGLEDQSSASGVLEEMCASIPPPSSTTSSTLTSSTRSPPSSSPSSHTSSPSAPSPRPQNPSPTPTPIVSPAPVTTTVHDGTTIVTSSPPGTTLIPNTSVNTGNVTTVVMSTITSPLPSGNAANGLVGGVTMGHVVFLWIGKEVDVSLGIIYGFLEGQISIWAVDLVTITLRV